MPFGLINAPNTFQSLVNDIFRPFLRKFVLVFFDDILIYNTLVQEYKGHMRLVLEVLAAQRFYVNRKRCELGKREVSYLGHVISSEGVPMDMDMVRAIMEWETPKSFRELRGFLGLTDYYRKFVARYSQIA